MLVLLCPGQGSQTPGLLLPWLEVPDARARLGHWSDLTGLDLVELGTQAPADVVRRTELAQPLLTAAALLSGRAVLGGATPGLVCGHSIGEVGAAALAGVITDDEAVVLAAGRGAAMADAAACEQTGMAALLGAEPAREDLTAAGLHVATVNAPGHVVVGGSREALAAYAPPKGTRVRQLQVAGAFHTAAMEPAREVIAALVSSLTASRPVCGFVANADGAVLHDGQQVLDRLAPQVTGPVRFDLCLQALVPNGATRAVELAPSGTLAALVRRVVPDLPVETVSSPDDALVGA